MTVAEETAPDGGVRLIRAVAPAFILFGIAIRVWMLANPVGALDSDEAISGFMARHILEGEFPIFYWGQAHGGPHEPLLAAGVFSIFGSSTLALKLVSAFLSAVACVLVWRVGRRTVGEGAAIVAALLFWTWPAAFVWWSVKARGFYQIGVAAGLGMVLLALRLQQRDSALEMAVLGALVGTGFWISPQTIFFSVPVLLWLVVKRFRILKLAPVGVAGAIVGAFPWWTHNLDNDWVAIRTQPVSVDFSSYLDHLRLFLMEGVPPALGLKYPDGDGWIGDVVGQVFYGALLALFIVALVRWKGPTRLLVVIAFAYPFLYSISAGAEDIHHPRYLYFLAPFLALLIARGLVALRPVVAVAGLVAALILTTVAGISMQDDPDFVPTAEGVAVPQDFDPLFDYLDGRGIDHAYAHYWLCYVLGFESAEELVVTTYSGGIRHFAAEAEVRAAPIAAYIFIAGSPSDPALAQALGQQGIAFERVQVGSWVVFIPSQHVYPESIPATPEGIVAG